MTVTHNRYKFVTVSLPKKTGRGRAGENGVKERWRVCVRGEREMLEREDFGNKNDVREQ